MFDTRSNTEDGDNISPLVFIGLAVDNGQNFLAEALDSILEQSFRDFELIIYPPLRSNVAGLRRRRRSK